MKKLNQFPPGPSNLTLFFFSTPYNLILADSSLAIWAAFLAPSSISSATTILNLGFLAENSDNNTLASS